VPSWKKVILSGSDASLNSLNVTTFVSASSFIGSFTGSFSGSIVAPGLDTQVIFNNSGFLAGDADLTFNGTTLTAANDVVVNGVCVGKGGGNIASNARLGANALANNTTGAYNAALGQNALCSNTTGAANTAIGRDALRNNTIGTSNTAIGIST
jgi:hypothetical protein